MPNRKLNDTQIAAANVLLTIIRETLDILGRGDAGLRFAYNRKIIKELSYDERGTPMQGGAERGAGS